MRALALLLVMLMTSPALASGDTGVVVVGEATMQPQVVAQIEGWLRLHGYQVVAAPLPPDAISTMVDCFTLEDEACAKLVVDRRSSADVVVFANVKLKSDTADRTVELTGYWFVKGKDATAERRFCERCTDQSLRAAADDLIAGLTKSRPGAIGRLELTSSPRGARVTIDGQSIGVTPLGHDLAPGNHTVALVHDGHEVKTRELAIRRGETTQVDIPLTPIAAGGRRILPLALAIGGAALAITGGVLIAMDEDESPMGPLEIDNTAPLGVGLAVAGGVAITAGVYLWLRRSVNSGVVANASRDGGYIGWSGNF